MRSLTIIDIVSSSSAISTLKEQKININTMKQKIFLVVCILISITTVAHDVKKIGGVVSLNNKEVFIKNAIPYWVWTSELERALENEGKWVDVQGPENASPHKFSWFLIKGIRKNNYTMQLTKENSAYSISIKPDMIYTPWPWYHQIYILEVLLFWLVCYLIINKVSNSKLSNALKTNIGAISAFIIFLVPMFYGGIIGDMNTATLPMFMAVACLAILAIIFIIKRAISK